MTDLLSFKVFLKILFFNIKPLYQFHEKFKNAQDAEEKTENLTLSRNQPRFGPEIIDKGGALTMTGRPMTCYQCLIDVPSTKKKERVRSRFCCVSCQKPVCLKKHAQIVCAECFQNLVTNYWLKNIFKEPEEILWLRKTYKGFVVKFLYAIWTLTPQKLSFITLRINLKDLFWILCPSKHFKIDRDFTLNMHNVTTIAKFALERAHLTTVKVLCIFAFIAWQT